METKNELMKWWKSKWLEFNIIIFLLVAILLLIEQLLFSFLMSFFLVPIILVFLLLINVAYFLFIRIFLKIRLKSDMSIDRLKKTYKWFVGIIYIMIFIYFVNLSIDNNSVKERNEQREKATEEWLKNKK